MAKHPETDSLNLVILINLCETNGFVPEAFKPSLIFYKELDERGNRIIKNNSKLFYERNYIFSVFKKVLNQIKLIEDTTCFRGLLPDSVSRRNFNDIKESARRCNFKNLVVLDIKWSYMNKAHYNYSKDLGKFKSYYSTDFPATTFTIVIKFYSADQEGILYSHEYANLSLYGSQEPGEILNNHEHSKFFLRAAKDFNKFLKSTGK